MVCSRYCRFMSHGCFSLMCCVVQLEVVMSTPGVLEVMPVSPFLCKFSLLLTIAALIAPG